MTVLCWILRHPDGTAYDGGDGVEHFDGAEVAMSVLDAVTDVKPSRLDQPCAVVGECGCCGETLSEFSETHFPTQAEADKALAESGWRKADDGSLRCSFCVSAHTREATTPQPDGTLLADCSCGGTYSVSQGGNEHAKLEAEHRAHEAGAGQVAP